MPPKRFVPEVPHAQLQFENLRVAESALLLGEYRKLDPGPIEEWIFFDHPGGRTRIYSAMRWKAENLH